MIIHIFRIAETKGTRSGWEAFDETGRWRGCNEYLCQFRTIFEVPLHRGPHPVVRVPEVYEVAAYWLDTEERTLKVEKKPRCLK